MEQIKAAEEMVSTTEVKMIDEFSTAVIKNTLHMDSVDEMIEKTFTQENVEYYTPYLFGIGGVSDAFVLVGMTGLIAFCWFKYDMITEWLNPANVKWAVNYYVGLEI